MFRPLGPIGGRSRPHLSLASTDNIGRPPAELSRAVCAGVDTEIFFDGDPAAVETAKSLCSVCPARTACLEQAMRNGERYGIFGGLTPAERTALRRKEVRAA